uniref:Uncharacterized protein n=1 Tax=Rhizophora mucronata TaxID=61149 RepID=A0A2P2NWD7_RHIMU
MSQISFYNCSSNQLGDFFLLWKYCL